jgi:hypothetical protein
MFWVTFVVIVPVLLDGVRSYDLVVGFQVHVPRSMEPDVAAASQAPVAGDKVVLTGAATTPAMSVSERAAPATNPNALVLRFTGIFSRTYINE